MPDTQTVDKDPALANLLFRQGDDFRQTINVTNLAGTGYDLTTAKVQIRTPAGVLLKELTVGSGITLTNPGTLTLFIAKAETATFVPTVYEYDLQVVFTASGDERTLIEGQFRPSAQKTV